MVPISHREGDYIATASAPTDALQEVIPITVRRQDNKVAIEMAWRPGPGWSTAADLNAAMVAAVRKAKQWADACGIDAPEADVHPLHERARAAIERLGLDGSRLELAVAVFGWGSDEANGSLLGLVKSSGVWGEHCWDASEDYTGASLDVDDGPSIVEVGDGAFTRVLVGALEAAQ